MNNIKTTFSIKDLENLSGIKAHTIRMWEKRYQVLEPMRTDTNIRLYDANALQKLLNISLLNDYGYKISKISQLSHDNILDLVNETVSDKNAKSHAISAFKMAMMNFDQNLFIATYNDLLSEKTFKEIFITVFLPLLSEIGTLWQTETITPVHEHFISYLIKQKILVNTEKLQANPPTRPNRVFALYLPVNEIHELGLMYLNYELLAAGYKTVFLGESVPISCLSDIKRHFDNVIFVCYATVQPSRSEVNDYIQEVTKEVLDESTSLWMIGKMAEYVETENRSGNICVLNSIYEFIEKIQ